MFASSVRVVSAGVPSVVGIYTAREATLIPKGFTKVCNDMRWDAQDMWNKLNDHGLRWYLAENGSYIYRNKADGQWWMDEPSGGGVYVNMSEEPVPPSSGWKALSSANSPLPQLVVVD